jgi:hypothetical protein
MSANSQYIVQKLWNYCLLYHKAAFHPPASALILTHIFGKVLGKWLDKAEVLLISTIRAVLPGSFAKLICKMWVRIRASATGVKGRRRRRTSLNLSRSESNGEHNRLIVAGNPIGLSNFQDGLDIFRFQA